MDDWADDPRQRRIHNEIVQAGNRLPYLFLGRAVILKPANTTPRMAALLADLGPDVFPPYGDKDVEKNLSVFS